MRIGKSNAVIRSMKGNSTGGSFSRRDELQIGGIYIRIYNEMPTFPIVNPKSFVIDLLDFLKHVHTHLLQSRSSRSIDGILQPTLAANHPSKRQSLKRESIDGVLNEYNRSKALSQLEKSCFESNPSATYDSLSKGGDLIENTISVLKALISVIKSNPNVEIQCIGHFEMLFGFVSTNLCNRDKEIKSLALEIVSLVSRNKECVSEIAACELLGQFLIALKDDDLRPMQLKVLETLSGLLNVQRMVKEAQGKGAVIYLLDLFSNSRNPQIREFCADMLGKMTADKLSGPKVCRKSIATPIHPFRHSLIKHLLLSHFRFE